jgi:hypothetical protein
LRRESMPPRTPARREHVISLPHGGTEQGCSPTAVSGSVPLPAWSGPTAQEKHACPRRFPTDTTPSPRTSR